MNENWTRRQLLRHTGTAAAAAAGLGLVGCGTSRAAKNYSAGPAKDLQHFVSRPDLTPPKVTLTVAEPADQLRYLFLGLANSGPGQGGTMIMDTRGNLIWFSPDTVLNSKMDFQAQSYRGKPVLTWFQGRVVNGGHGEGYGMIADSSYNTIAIIRATSGLMVDLHEFVVTPRGTALITAYRTLDDYDLSSIGGPKKGWLLSGFAQEIDIATGKLVFEWDSLDHVGLDESYLRLHGDGLKSKPYDYFHINSIADYDDEHLMIGARNTWCVYLVKRSTGEIVWRLNGKKSDFTMGPGSQFYWQHDTRPHGTKVLTVFDDGYDGVQRQDERQSRALVLDVDTDKMAVTLGQAYTHPGVPVLAKAMGNAQLLPGGGMFVGWGTNPYFSEFGPDGKLVLDGKLTKGDPTYRSFIGDWTGTPSELPALAARRRPGGATVYASWNGATEVASWTVLADKAGGNASMVEVGSAPRTGFETVIPVRSTGPYFSVQPRDAAGRPLSMSLPVRIV